MYDYARGAYIMGVSATIFLLIVIATLGTDGLAYIILAGLALCFMVGMIQGMVERSRNKSNRKEIIVKPNVNTDTNNRLDSCSKINHRCTMSANIPNCTLDLYQNASDKEAKRKQYASLVRVAGMSGSQFEKFCAELLECNGFGLTKEKLGKRKSWKCINPNPTMAVIIA